MIELCRNYTTSGHPHFKPVCSLGYRAGLWCHAYDKLHHCGRYSIELVPQIMSRPQGSKRQQAGYAKRLKTMTLCSVCEHHVFDMEKHSQTEEHRRNTRHEGGSK